MNSKAARRNLLLAFIVCVAVFWLTASLITTQGMRPWEHSVFNVIYDLPLSWKTAMIGITQAGGALMVAAVCLVLLLGRHRLAAIRVLIVTSVTYGMVFFAKQVYARPRAFQLLHVAERGPRELGYGFPSAHAAIAMAVGVALLPVVPRKWWWLIFSVVALVAASRVYLGVHSPLDVVGGMAIGGAISVGYLLIMASRQSRKTAKVIPKSKRPKNKTI